MIELEETDKVPGSGILTSHFSDGAKMLAARRDPLDDRLLRQHRDESRRRRSRPRQDGGELMEKLGYPETKLHSFVFNRETSLFPERSKKYGLGSTTPADMVSLLEKLQKKELVSKEASEKMLAHLYACADKSTFPRYLPEREDRPQDRRHRTSAHRRGHHRWAQRSDRHLRDDQREQGPELGRARTTATSSAARSRRQLIGTSATMQRRRSSPMRAC